MSNKTSDKNVGSIEDIRDLLLFFKSHGWIPDIRRTINVTIVILAIKENKHLLNKDWYNICPFLNYKNECDIYKNRPLICREYSCYNYEHNIYNLEVFSKIPEKNFKITNVRKEIFNDEGI